jgi:hypothetical protein
MGEARRREQRARQHGAAVTPIHFGLEMVTFTLATDEPALPVDGTRLRAALAAHNTVLASQGHPPAFLGDFLRDVILAAGLRVVEAQRAQAEAAMRLVKLPSEV